MMGPAHVAMSLVQIYSSTRVAECEQRSFLLYAVGIESYIEPRNGEFALLVVDELRDAALEELRRHEDEARAAAAASRPRPTPRRANAWVGSVMYGLIMVVVAYCAGESLFGVDWTNAGALRSSVVESGEWSRLVTALTLHGDVAHLLANLAFGIFFGYFAGQLLGPGVAWLSILLAAAMGNLLDSLVMSSDAMSLGASTAVFATLGLVAAYSWRGLADSRMRWAHRWAPLIAGVALLAFTGAGGERTDVVAHVAGFLCGAGAGALHATRPMQRLHAPIAQAPMGLLALAIVIAAWAAALGRQRLALG